MPTSADESMEVESSTQARCPASNGHTDLLGPSCSPADLVENLVESVSLEQGIPTKTGENETEGASEGAVSESSRESTPLVTETMVAEEERLREERGDSSERQQVKTVNNSQLEK